MERSGTEKVMCMNFTVASCEVIVKAASTVSRSIYREGGYGLHMFASQVPRDCVPRDCVLW